MSETTMHVEVVSADASVLSGEAREVYARAIEGEIGILPGHAPALVALDVGPLRVTMADGSRERIAVHRGVLFVGDDGKVIVLSDIAERAEDIDVERARAKAGRIRKRLAEGTVRNVEIQLISLRKQQLRIAVGTGSEVMHDS
jgi:F-type H+-transporting ATPase subunit epsilon